MGIDDWIKIGFALVVGGIWLINQILSKRDSEPPPAERPRPLPPRRRPIREGMEPKDVDQFLDEVMGRGGVGNAGARPQAGVPEGRVVVLRPSQQPGRPRPQQEPRRATRPAAMRPEQQPTPAQSVLVKEIPTGSKATFSEQVQQSVDQAAAATQSAAALRPTIQQPLRHSAFEPSAFATMLKSPTEIRRAFLLREILGPPRAHRRR